MVEKHHTVCWYTQINPEYRNDVNGPRELGYVGLALTFSTHIQELENLTDAI